MGPVSSPDAAPSAPPARPRPAEPTVAATGVVERGSFAHATCEVCGWRGPGRRARASAGQDGELHALAEHAARPGR